MLNAIDNIHSINKLVEQSSDDQIIRATNTKLKTDESTKTYFYVRKNKIDQIFQKLTDWTDGAKAKQTLAKNQIISNLKIIKDNPEFDKKFPNKDRREQALALMNKIIMTVSTAEKDITSSMIKKDLLSLNGFLRTYETIEKKSEHSVPVEDSSEGDVANSEAESELNAVKDNLENKINANISKNMSSYLSKLANVTSVDVAEVIFNSEDPEVDGSRYKESNSQSAESTINNPMHALKNVPPVGTEKMSNSILIAVEIPDIQLMRETLKVVNYSGSTDVAKAIKKYESKQVDSSPMDAAEAATEGTPSLAPSAPSAKTETKTNAKANPYLESLKTEWDPADDGYHTIIKPFFITGGVPTTSMIAQAYIIPAGKKLNFTEEVDVLSSGLDGGVVQAKHILHKHRDTDTQRDTRPYLKLSAKAPNSILVGPSNLTKNSKNKQQMLDRFKADLKNTYLESFKKINEEHKKINSGKQLETLVIVPLSSLPLILSEVESEVLASAVLAIQNENQDLKIHISAAETLHENRIRSAYEKLLKEST